MAPPGAGPPSPRGSDRGEGARPARPHVPARPTFCMGAYLEQLQDKDVRGDMLRSQTIIGILAEALDLKDKRGLLERSKSRGIRAPSLTGGSLEEDKDDPELFAPDTDSQFAKRRKMIHRVLKDDIEKELGNKVEFKKVPPSDNRLRKIFKVTGSELKVLINAVKNEPADCFDVEVKRLLLQFPDLVRLRLKEELDVDSLLTSTSTAQKTKGNKSMTTHQKHTETRQNEVCVEKWRDEWGAVEVTLEFERHEWIADRGDKVIKKGVYPRLLSIDVRFDLPRYTRRDHGAHGPTGATGTQTWTPPLQAGSRDFDVVNQWKERLLSELLSELAAQRSGLPQDVKEGRTVAKGKMDELYRSAAAELVVQSVLQAIEERGSQLMRRWRLERPPDPRFPDPGDLLRLHAIHADGGEQTSKHAANDYDMSKNQYHFVQLNVDRPVDEREATQVWDMVMQLVTKFGDKTAEMRQELRAKLNQLADPDNRLEQKPNGEWPSRKVPDPYVRRLVNQRRRAKDLDLDGRTIHTEGTLLYFAMRAKVPHQVLDELLEHGADPEALQSLHPLGIHQAVLRAPILYFAKDVEQVQTLIENDADTESKSCLKGLGGFFHSHDDVVDVLLRQK
ncbi:unnamed protein product [Prorocentrum cordatum]|uniref:Uncharacterized protein n=1 Tax=Prorocentrum cordatum TaxID=2364126 RepID=A0ABN9WT90_9DINO|nr:unnamed protein product [Polarella glacialis]